MSVYFLCASCCHCGKRFICNPHLVPTANGEPVCKECVEWANPIRKERGLSLISVLPGAYEVASEEDEPRA